MLRDFKIVKLALVTTNKNKKQQNLSGGRCHGGAPGICAIGEQYDMQAGGEHVVLLRQVCREQ
jgi:hypothetical protein